MSATSYGLCFHCDEPALSVITRAQAAEVGGFDDFWLIEDGFYAAGISLAATARPVPYRDGSWRAGLDAADDLTTRGPRRASDWP